MSERVIVLNSIEGAREFVNAASACDFDVDVYFNRIALDAKSLLGILSLDLRSILRVRYCGNNEKFNHVLNKYASHA
jgi:phosphotransferase system HPr-like phosphotransfer protein